MRNLTFTMLLILVASCNKPKDTLQGEWIPSFCFDNSGEESFIPPNKTILKFYRDSLIIRRITFKEMEMIDSLSLFSFSLNDSLILLSQQGVLKDTLQFSSIHLDSIQINNCIYKRNESFALGDKKKEIEKRLTSSTLSLSDFFSRTDSVEINFLENGLFAVNDFDLHWPSGRMWKLDHFGNDLYLSTYGYFGMFCQVKEIRKDSIFLKSYGMRNELNTKLYPIKKKFKNTKKYLVGKWEEELEIPYPPIEEKDRDKYFLNEVLEITDSRIIKYKYFRIDTFHYDLFANGNGIFIYNDWENPWSVFEINEKELWIRRRKKYRWISDSWNRNELISFQRLD